MSLMGYVVFVLKTNSIAVNSSFESLLTWLVIGSKRRSADCKSDTLVSVPASPGKATSQFNMRFKISVQATVPASPKIVSSEQ